MERGALPLRRAKTKAWVAAGEGAGDPPENYHDEDMVGSHHRRRQTSTTGTADAPALGDSAVMVGGDGNGIAGEEREEALSAKEGEGGQGEGRMIFSIATP